MFQHKGVILFIQLIAVYLQRVSSTSINCSDLTFGYGEQQTGVSPFRIDVQNSANGQLNVTLTSNDSSTFQGFILQARKVGTDMVLGTFVKLPSGTKAFQCNNTNDTATHSSNSSTGKFTLTFTWSPPDNVTGIIVFNATVAANYSAYWLGISSKEISLPLMSTPRLTTRKATQSPSLSPSQSVSMQQPSLTPSPSQSPSVGEPPVSTQSPSIAPSQSLSMQQPSLTPSPSQSPSVGDPPVSTQSPSIAPSQSSSMQQPSLTPSPSQSPSVGEPSVSTQSPSIASSQSLSMQQPSLTPSPSQSASVGEPPVSTQSPSITTHQLSVNVTQISTQPPMNNISSTHAQTSVAPPVSSTPQPTTPQPTTPKPTTPQPTTFEVEMTIDQAFDKELNDKTSKRFQDLSTAVKTGVESVYKRANRIVEVSVESFKSGSIIAQLSLKFPTPVNASQALNPLQNAIKSKSFTILNSTVVSIDVDECISNPCDKNAACNNNVGSFTCTCNEGFTGDGKKCTVTKDDDDDDIKNILVASLVLVAIILLLVLFFFVVLIRRLLTNK